MTWFRRPYYLGLVEDKRHKIIYKKFIGRERVKKSYYIRSVELGDEFARGYRKEKVLLRKVQENTRLRILAVQVEDAII